ncbi:hypothetical protein ACWA1F_13125 [Flavobacterium sp. 3-218]
MKNKIIIVTLLFITIISYSQQIGDGFASGLSINDYNQPLKSGIYEINAYGINPDESYSWQHLFVMRHSNSSNNFQLQFSSSFNNNDRIFFRKITNSSNSSWNELATRGANTFNGDQYLAGNQSITGNLFLGQHGEVHTLSGPGNSGAIQIKTNIDYAGSNNRYLRLGWRDNNALFSPALSINEDLNVGIGTVNPQNKLDVKGTIHSQEVKVDMENWSDFVFKKEYNLPTLDQVEKHIEEKGHLENIPSEEEVLKNGINLGEMDTKLLQKIEELTLYSIQQNKKIEEQSKEIESLTERLSKIEKLFNSK